MLATVAQTKGRQEWRRYVAFSFASSDLLVELDRRMTIQFITGATEELIGLKAQGLQGRDFLELLDPEDGELLGAAIEVLAPGQRLSQRTVSFAKGRGEATIAGFRLPDDEGRVYLAASRILIPSLARAMAERDNDTGLLRADDFSRLVEDQIQLLQDARQDAALCLVQLDDLDQLRARIGESATQEMLKDLGILLRGNSVGGDSAGRLADDKYGVVQSPGNGSAALKSKVERLIQKADPDGPATVERRAFSLTDHLMSNLAAAQAVRYVVNRFVDQDLQTIDIDSMESGFELQMAETMERIETLKRTVAEDSISLVFQPIVALSDHAIHHYEALTRFAGGGSPYETITFAEQVGIIQDFDLAVAVKTRDFVRQSLDGRPNLSIAVNLSPRSLESDGFVEALRDLMGEEPKLRKQILFELTESYKVRDLERVNAITQHLRQDGHLVCLDDFGAGGASFDYLQAIQVDFVKLDGTYVRRMMETERDSSILTAMADLCRMLKIATIAEFVETKEQADKLLGLGVGFGQGWLFGKPQPNPEIQAATPAAPLAAPSRPRAKRRQGEDTVWA